MNLLFRSLLKRGCKGKLFFDSPKLFSKKIFRRPEGRGNSRKTRAGASQRLTFHRTNAPAGTPISQTGLQRYCFFPYLQIFLKLFLLHRTKNTDKTRNALEDRRLRKQKFSHKKTADGGTEGGREPGGAKDSKPPSRHTGKEREGRTEEEEDGRARENYGMDNQTFPDKATENHRCNRYTSQNRHIII